MKGKHTYTCPICESDHHGWAMWRHHVSNSHGNVDPLHESGIAKAIDKVEVPEPQGPPVEGLNCTWPGCSENRKDWDAIRSHMAAAHGNGLNDSDVDSLRRSKPTVVAEQLGSDFQTYLKKRDDFEAAYPE